MGGELCPVLCLNKQHYFKPGMCLDLVLERKQFVLFQIFSSQFLSQCLSQFLNNYLETLTADNDYNNGIDHDDDDDVDGDGEKTHIL